MFDNSLIDRGYQLDSDQIEAVKSKLLQTARAYRDFVVFENVDVFAFLLAKGIVRPGQTKVKICYRDGRKIFYNVISTNGNLKPLEGGDFEESLKLSDRRGFDYYEIFHFVEDKVFTL